MTEYSIEEAKYRDKLISNIEEILKDLTDTLSDEKPKLRVVKDEG